MQNLKHRFQTGNFKSKILNFRLGFWVLSLMLASRRWLEVDSRFWIKL